MQEALQSMKVQIMNAGQSFFARRLKLHELIQSSKREERTELEWKLAFEIRQNPSV